MKTFEQFACKDEEFKRPVELANEKTSMSSPFARDKDVILYSNCFRRLAHKTQVYLTGRTTPELNEHSRTRLTHTLEVVSISKAITKSLGLNVDLAEAIAFGHDVGHAPFGHAGENQLSSFLNGKIPLPRIIRERFITRKLQKAENRGARDVGDFRHNYQGVRQLYFLIGYSPHYTGLNLTYQTLEGILKHTGLKSRTSTRLECKYPKDDNNDDVFDCLIRNTKVSSTVESVVVALADEIAQICHDLSDAVELEQLPLDEFYNLLPVQRAVDFCNNIKGKQIAYSKTHSSTINNAQISSALVEYFITNTHQAISAILEKANDSENRNDIVRRLPVKPQPENDFTELNKFKDMLVINNYNMNRMDNKGAYIIRRLTDAYLSDPRQLPDEVLKNYTNIKIKEYHKKGADGFLAWFAERAAVCGILPEFQITQEEQENLIKMITSDTHGNNFRKVKSELINSSVSYLALDGDYLRVIADYIATMTDVYAMKEVAELYSY